MNKKRLLLASILKPVDDIRMYEKIALSLQETQRYEITTIGFTSQAIPQNSPIHFIEAFKFRRTSLSRWLAPWKVFKTSLQVKPELLIINSFELLIVSLVIRILFGCKIYYDVQENYYRNIREGYTLPKYLSVVPAVLIRLLEYSSRLWVSGYLLAERNYEKEFGFCKGKSIVIENKFKKPSQFEIKRTEPSTSLRLVYTGTVSESYGVLETLKLAESLSIPRAIHLHIIGHCHSDKLRKVLEQKAKKYDWIKLEISPEPIPHPLILVAIQQADFGLLSYRINPSTENCIPTKLYEYLACELPIISVPNLIWQSLIEEHQGGFVWDFNQTVNHDFLTRLEGPFYPKPPKDVWWEEEAVKLILFIQ